VIWLGEQRGFLSDWITQLWVRATGRGFRREEIRWLEGPAGGPRGVGAAFFDDLANRSGLEARRLPAAGLLSGMDELAGPEFYPRLVQPEVSRFYERTAAYELDVWSQWSGFFRPLGWLLAVLFSRRLQQLNIPLSPLDTSYGMTSEIIQLVAPDSGQVVCTAWLRRLHGSGHVLYAGTYSVCVPPRATGPCVKVVFPLPNGYAAVVMRPRVDAEGALTLLSSGDGIGAPGFYFVVHGAGDRAWVRHVRRFREQIRVYATGGALHADHVFRFCGVRFLRLHYRMRAAQPSG
jgi:hypothetical protein